MLLLIYLKTESEISNEKIETMNEFHLSDDCLEKIPKKLLYLNKKSCSKLLLQKFSCEFHHFLLVQFHFKILIFLALTFLKIF